MTNHEGWHAFEYADCIGIGIGPIPGREQVALYKLDGADGVVPIAYFKAEEDAMYVLQFMEGLLNHPFRMQKLND